MKRVVFVIGLLITAFVLCGCSSIQTVTLLTAQEGAMKDAPDDKGYGFALVETESSTGPHIKILKPEPNIDHRAPLGISIDFLAKPNTQVDISTLRVEVLKFLTIDITDRVKTYANPKGIYVEKADFPSGKHKVRVIIGDDKGGVTEQIFFVRVL